MRKKYLVPETGAENLEPRSIVCDSAVITDFILNGGISDGDSIFD